MTEPHDGDIEKIKDDILLARKWAREHFPTDGSDTLLDSPKFLLTFEKDTMVVSPKMYGRSFQFGIRYRLAWVGEHLYWTTTLGRHIQLQVR